MMTTQQQQQQHNQHSEVNDISSVLIGASTFIRRTIF